MLYLHIVPMFIAFLVPEQCILRLVSDSKAYEDGLQYMTINICLKKLYTAGIAK
jgi:hypothetical protein